jgi:hypothetical protein
MMIRLATAGAARSKKTSNNMSMPSTQHGSCRLTVIAVHLRRDGAQPVLAGRSKRHTTDLMPQRYRGRYLPRATTVKVRSILKSVWDRNIAQTGGRSLTQMILLILSTPPNARSPLEVEPCPPNVEDRAKSCAFFPASNRAAPSISGIISA